MKKSIVLFLVLLTCGFIFSQKIENLPNRFPKGENENVAVEQIATESLCTSFMVWVKGGVKHHFHSKHTECIYVLEGIGQMTLADSTFIVQPGDFVLIPKGTIHSVVATTPLKILSIQTPQWVSDDRQFVQPFRRPHNE